MADTRPTATSAAAAVAAPAPAPDVRGGRALKVTVSDVDALECGVCMLALRPPIFQCNVGHVVCSACRDKMEAIGNGKCHICRVATRGYSRCHAMEKLLDSIRVPCPYVAHGCDVAPPYHGQESHRQVCPHAPCHCPSESCGFIGSTGELMDHFNNTHKWPCWASMVAGKKYVLRLRDGFNSCLLKDHDGDQSACVPCRLFLLNVTQERLGRAISVLCIHPHASGSDAQQLSSTQCELVFSRKGDVGSLCSHTQSSVFKVVCTDLSNGGLPNPEGCFRFFVDNAVLGDGDGDGDGIQVSARIIN